MDNSLEPRWSGMPGQAIPGTLDLNAASLTLVHVLGQFRGTTARSLLPLIIPVCRDSSLGLRLC